MNLDRAALLLFALVIATMPAYAIGSRRRIRDPDVARRPTSVLFGFWVRDWMVWILGPVERLLVRGGVSPDFLNYAGVAAGIGAGVFIAMGRLSLGAWLIGVGGISDILDGRIARARGLASRSGAFLDSTLDQFAETGKFVGVAWFLWPSRWMTVATVLAVTGSLLVSYARARGEAMGVDFTGGLMPRAERVVLLVFGALFDSTVTALAGWAPGTVLSGAVVIIASGTLGTAVYRTVRIARALR
jgi:phosphatidylglycerophosphate synthase